MTARLAQDDEMKLRCQEIHRLIDQYIASVETKESKFMTTFAVSRAYRSGSILKLVLKQPEKSALHTRCRCLTSEAVRLLRYRVMRNANS